MHRIQFLLIGLLLAGCSATTIFNSPDAERFLRRLQNGWMNHGPFPKMEQLTFGGNFVYVYRVKGDKAFIRTFNNGDTPLGDGPDKTNMYNMTHNPLIHLFSTVYRDGKWEMSAPVGLVFTLVIANPDDGPLWIDIHDLIRTENDGTPIPSPTPK